MSRALHPLSHCNGHIASLRPHCNHLQNSRPDLSSRISAANVIYAPHLEMERRKNSRSPPIHLPLAIPSVHCTPHFAGMGMRACKYGVILQAASEGGVGQQKKLAESNKKPLHPTMYIADNTWKTGHIYLQRLKIESS